MNLSPKPDEYHCTDCGVYFNSTKSLNVHLNYHKDNLVTNWITTTQEESNNAKEILKLNSRSVQDSEVKMERFSPNCNFPTNGSSSANSFFQFSPTSSSDARKNSEIRPNSTADIRPHSVDMRPPSADMRPPSVDMRPNTNSPKFSVNDETHFVLSSDFENSPSASPHLLHNTQNFRFHPYQHHSYPDRTNGLSSSSSPVLQLQGTPQQCEKCGCICDSQTSLIDHLNTAHPPGQNVTFNFNNGYSRSQIKIEPQAEILDLDSHKVHVYQPPVGQQNQNSQNNDLSLPWIGNLDQDKKLFNTGHVNGNQMPSPDYRVTTTTMNPPEAMTQSYQYDHIAAHVPLQRPGTNPTQVPLVNQQKNPGPTKSGNSWKSNEARRPKTYNCTACNKWFTSSGHLKRHYNTTLHKNAVKQSGAPDPANLPISNHHHPQKDTIYSARQGSPVLSTVEEPPPNLTPKPEDFERAPVSQQFNFVPNHPNLLAGPSDISGGLLLPQPTQQFREILMPEEATRSLPSIQNQDFIHYQPTPMVSYPQGTPIYPNFQPPRVTTPQTITSITGNFDVQLIDNMEYQWERSNNNNYEPLPSFARNFGGILPSFAPFHTHVVSTSENNVGGLRSAQYEPLYPDQSSEDLHSSDTLDNNNSESCSLDGTVAVPCEDHSTGDELENNKLENLVSSTIFDNIEKTPNPPHRCDDCDKVFNKACYLTQHNKTFHTGHKPHKCEKCGKRFEEITQLEDHLKKHAGEKPYKCEICPKQFNHKTDLRRHMCLHTGDKPFACSYCGKGFIRKDHMIKHLETHKRKQSLVNKYPVQHKSLQREDGLLRPVPVVRVMH